MVQMDIYGALFLPGAAMFARFVPGNITVPLEVTVQAEDQRVDPILLVGFQPSQIGDAGFATIHSRRKSAYFYYKFNIGHGKAEIHKSW